MELTRLLAVLEETAPIGLAEKWDNPGLLISPEREDIKKVLVALDATPAVAKEAAACGADMVLTHHPLFFSPVKHVLRDDPQTAAAWALIRNGIGLFAAHTNLDTAISGVNDALAGILGLADVRPLLMPDAPLTEETVSIGRVGMLPSAMPLADFAAFVGERLHTRACYAGDGKRAVQRVALLGGSGGDFLPQAKAAGADVLVTGEAKHHEGLAAEVLQIGLVVAGHYETEQIVLSAWIEGLQKRLKAIECKVDFVISQAGTPPFTAV
ncbi:MAG: Nif3-like dinuclear metal center hexameric protein [Eubacteriales bacterium]|nr:Nif3-like dinuclear metal center hexameric protein [Eubacteriales bacterium]